MKITLKSLALVALMLVSYSNAEAQISTKERSGGNEPGAICGTQAPSQQWEDEFQKLIGQMIDTKTANKAQATLYTIPVIIHVIHGGQPVGTYPNLAQGQLNSQIQVLNNDYGGIGFNTGNYPANAFSGYASAQSLPAANLDAYGRVQIANTNVQFCLATKDTAGNILAEPGIERINYVTKGWSNPGTLSGNALQNYMNNVIKPQTIWNVSKYLNIWVSDISSSASLLGYATFPPLSGLSGLPGSFGTAATDGFWCVARAFGAQSLFPGGTYMPGYTCGRTSTHEIGHWLGLRHVWGDGTCLTDYCNDTPPAYDNNFGSPTYPLNITGTASCNGAVNGAMFMNFMDYTNDPVKYMFTTDQAKRIQTAMMNSPYRKFMGTHGLCSVAEISAASQFKLPSTICGTTAVTFTNTSVGTPVPSYTWSASGGAIISPNANIPGPNISFPAAGVYTITLASDNGTLSTTSKTINVYALPNLVLSTPTMVCMNDLVVITASGGNTYDWLPSYATTSTVSYVATADRSYTCTTTDVNLCKSTATVFVTVAECLGISTQAAKERSYSLYPNPSAGKVNVVIHNTTDALAAIQVTDASGRVVRHFESFTVDKNQVVLDLESLSKGIYFLKLTSREGVSATLKLAKE